MFVSYRSHFIILILVLLVYAEKSSQQSTAPGNIPVEETTPTEKPVTSSPKEHNLNTGEISGIVFGVIGSILAILAIAVACICSHPGWKLSRKLLRDRKIEEPNSVRYSAVDQTNTADTTQQDLDNPSSTTPGNTTTPGDPADLPEAGQVTEQVPAVGGSEQGEEPASNHTEVDLHHQPPAEMAEPDNAELDPSQRGINAPGDNNTIIIQAPGSVLHYYQSDSVDSQELKESNLIEGKLLASGSFCQVSEVTFKSGTYRGHSKGAAKKINQLKQEEIDISKSVKHPHIVTLLGYVCEGFASLLVMELADQSLRQYLNDHKGNIITAVLENWSRQVCRAIAYLHRGVEMPNGQMKFIVHRDIKASNCLLFQKNGTFLLKVADFGISRGINHTMAGTKMGKGTLPWTAPEIQKANASDVDALFSCKSDIFGLGVLFWEMFTQENPKEQSSVDPNRWEIPAEPVYLKRLLLLCWKIDPEQRPAIQQVIKNLPGSALDVIDASEFYCLQAEDMSKEGLIKSGSYSDVLKVTFNLKNGLFRGHEKAAAKRINRLEPLEIEIMSCVSHDHIVKFLAYVTGMNSMLVMELADGSLREYLNDNRGSTQEPLLEKWVREACMAIDYLHGGVELYDGVKLPIVHRDIKASNCLLFGITLKVSDFGISKATDHTTGTSGQGSYPWKAPELRGKTPRFSVKSDIYSLGVLIYEIYSQHTLDANQEQFSVPASFPDHLKTLLPRCWEKDYTKRCTIKDVIGGLPTDSAEFAEPMDM